ncbi:L-lysine exporter family protein LysE/ArgO [Neisseria sp. HSC-16F19]|nr:LysE family transporter [Neisseria sp. HSC-16F19]MCP2040947.1 L-lysine exporter family protein LysE/ArgO [Neisseria sp. HSC-16F19]
MFSIFMAGFMMMSGLIIAIGAQNTFVLKQGLLRQHVLLVAGVCWLCDVLLMAAGIWGLAAVVQRYSGLLPVLSVAGALFLIAYGVFALLRAWRGGQALAVQAQNGAAKGQSAKNALLLTLGLTLLNPHVYLDTVLLVGSVASPLAAEGKWAFWLGASTLSGLWFFGLGFGARLLLPLFKRESTWRLLDSAIALMMFYLAYGLLRGVF